MDVRMMTRKRVSKYAWYTLEISLLVSSLHPCAER